MLLRQEMPRVLLLETPTIAPHPIIRLAATEKQTENQGAATGCGERGEFH